MLKALVSKDKVIGVANLSVKETGYIMFKNGNKLDCAKIVSYAKLDNNQKEEFNNLKEKL